MSTMVSALEGPEGERIALCDVAVAAVLRDLLAEVTVAQTYRNDEPVNIEAVYTFPLPLGAVLLELEVEIGGRVLAGVVVGKQAAAERYEDAVEAGDAAVMLEAVEPGLYTMDVGNLLPGETAKITFRYALLHRWAGDRLRFSLPTTIAPRYGESPHLPHQAPEVSLTVENKFSLRVEIFGALRDAQFTCPSHAVELARSAERAVLSLQQAKAVMDRDFVLDVKASQAQRGFVQCGQDGEGVTAIASFQPFFPGLQQRRPLALAIVVDCSGSMEGDSIGQAKQALDGILDSLQPDDQVTLVAFGSSTRTFSNRLLPCNAENLAAARQFTQSLDADLGGTEVRKALRKACATVKGTSAADIFLVTDGEVEDWEPVVAEARTWGHRIFTVGVGSAVSEAFVRGLASATGGECELVTPREGMADRVMRHFERMRAPRAKRVEVHWPDGAASIGPSGIGAVFEGDTLVAWASFDRAPAAGHATLEVDTEQGEVVRQELAIPAPPVTSSRDGMSTVARVAAASRLGELDAEAGEATALRYRLVSPWTNWLVVAARAEGEQALDVPALRVVPQTLAAGWGGAGSVCAPRFLRKMAVPVAVPCRRSGGFASHVDSSMFADARMCADASEVGERGVPAGNAGHRLLRELVDAQGLRLDLAEARKVLARVGLDEGFGDLLRLAADVGLDGNFVIAFVVASLLRRGVDELTGLEVASSEIDQLAREVRRVAGARRVPAPQP